MKCRRSPNWEQNRALRSYRQILFCFMILHNGKLLLRAWSWSTFKSTWARSLSCSRAQKIALRPVKGPEWIVTLSPGLNIPPFCPLHCWSRRCRGKFFEVFITPWPNFECRGFAASVFASQPWTHRLSYGGFLRFAGLDRPYPLHKEKTNTRLPGNSQGSRDKTHVLEGFATNIVGASISKRNNPDQLLKGTVGYSHSTTI